MKVTVSRKGAVIGVYERKDIRAAVADGSLQLDDRYFMPGMREWLPLSTLTKTLRTGPTENESTPDGSDLSPRAEYSWRRLATSAGYAIVAVAVLSALLSPSYWSQALCAAAGGMLILAARTLP